MTVSISKGRSRTAVAGSRLRFSLIRKVALPQEAAAQGLQKAAAQASLIPLKSPPIQDTVVYVYRANVGKVDARFDHKFLLDCQYVEFTGSKPAKKSNGFESRTAPYSSNSAQQAARWLKYHPHFLFRDSKIAVWFDANTLPTAFFHESIQHFSDSGADFLLVPHPQRQNVADEFEACIRRRKAPIEILRAQQQHFSESESLGLWETNVMITNLESPTAKGVLSDAWATMLRWSLRDQLALPYSLAKFGARVETLFPDNFDTFESWRYFARVPHKKVKR